MKELAPDIIKLVNDNYHELLMNDSDPEQCCKESDQQMQAMIYEINKLKGELYDAKAQQEAAFTLGYYYGVNGLQPDYQHSLEIWRQLEDRNAAFKSALHYLKHGY